LDSRREGLTDGTFLAEFAAKKNISAASRDGGCFSSRSLAWKKLFLLLGWRGVDRGWSLLKLDTLVSLRG
jgi:hypothetical protein